MDNTQMDINKVAAEVVSGNFEKILAALSKGLRDQLAKLQVEFSVAFNSYLKNAYDKYSRIKTLIYRTEPRYLYDFFVPSRLLLRNRAIDSGNIQEVLAVSRFVIIEGTGGIGKSTMMRHFFLGTLERGSHIPIFVELRDLNNFEGSFEDFLYFSVEKLGFSLEKKYFQQALGGGCFLLLMDGYDEVAAAKSDAVFREIDEFCDRYPDNAYILTSRPNQSFVAFHRFAVLRVLPFDKAQALSLVGKIDYDTTIKAQFMEALDRELYEKHESFASNPLLLTMLLITFDNYAEIPEKLHIFYSNAFDTLYHKHDATKAGYRKVMRSGLGYDDFKRIFAEFSFMTYLMEQVEFTRDDMKQLLGRVARHAGDFSMQDYIDDLEHAVCLINRDGPYYAYSHRSFQEYFAACFIQALPDAQQTTVCLHILEQNSNFAVTNSFFPMLSDMLGERFERNVLIPLLEDVERKIGPKTDRFAFFFHRLIRKAVFLEEDDGSFSLVMESDGVGPEDIILSHAIKIANGMGLAGEDDTELAHQINFWNDSDGLHEFDGREAMSSPDLRAVMKRSWMGVAVTVASSMLDTLREKHNRSLDDLYELING